MSIRNKGRFLEFVVAIAVEYAKELEHLHNGPETWDDEFSTDEEMIDDFILYIQNKRDPSGEQALARAHKLI